MPILILLFFWVSVPIFAEPCEYPGDPTAGLSVRDGYVEFIAAAELQPLKAALPQVANQEINTLLRSSDTMWYDEKSMVFFYQDSVEVVTGGRANCVGRKVGERNKDNPQIGKLLNFFGSDYRFRFPFRKAAGTDNVENIKVLDFWAPPKRSSRVMPVKWWRQSSRGRWSWVFPVGTVFGEVLYEKGPDGKWYVFEIRTRKRYLTGWDVDLYRPFQSAEALAQTIMRKRPYWLQDNNLSQVVNHLKNSNTLTPHRLESKPFAKVFPAIDGALDVLPEIRDASLVIELLTESPFVSMQGAIWKTNGRLETYAPSSSADFSIVPKGYEMGMIPVNEVSCNRCHSEVGRRLGEFEFDIILYGEVWGEDRIFTWHLFKPHAYIYDTWDDSDGSRTLNPKLVQANLLKNEKPGATDTDYKPLPSAFVPDRRLP